MQFNRHLGFRVRFKDKFWDNFNNRELQVKTCLKTQNMIRDKFSDFPKLSIELHPSTQDAAHGIFEGQCIPVYVPEADYVFRQKVSKGAGVPHL